MANNGAARMLPFIVLAVLSVSISSISTAQETQVPGDDASDQAIQALKAKALTETAPNPPNVSCKGDQLTISANNSTLGSVLAAVHSCTGVQIDIPAGAAGSRVFDQLGPGPARQILTSLLGATDFNYVIGSSDANPEKVDSVLLMVSAAEVSVGAGADRELTPVRRAWSASRQSGRSASSSTEDGSPEESGSSTAAARYDAVSAPVDSAGTNANQLPATNPASAATEAAPVVAEMPPAESLNQPKSTEDKITSMQQLFDQRRQMIQSQNSSKPQ